MRQLHKKAEEGSASGDGHALLPIWNRESRGEMEPGGVALPIAHLLGVVAVVGVLIWCGRFRGGLLWSGPDKDLLFNFHPVLMITGFIFIHGEANLVYRTARGSKNERKLLHLLLQGFALLLGAVGIFAAIKFHNDKGIDNFYSLHSWLGIFTVTVFSTQWLIGFTTFWYPGGASSTRAAILPWHVYLGLSVYSLALITAETGLLEKLTFMQTGKIIQRYGTEAAFVNSLGIVLVLLGFFVFLSVLMPNASRHVAYKI